MAKFALLILVLIGTFVLLYQAGYMVVNSKSAVSFIGSAGGMGASFTSCNGYIKRIVRFREGGTRRFTLVTRLTKGDVTVELLDSGKQRVMHLTRDNRSAAVTVEKGKKYYLITRFVSATGSYSLIRE